MYLMLVFIVMLISGTFILMTLEKQEMKKAEEELKKTAVYIDEQIIKEYSDPNQFQEGFSDLFMRGNLRDIQGNILDSSGKTIASTVSTDKSLFLEYNNSTVISALSGTESFNDDDRNLDFGSSTVKQWINYAYPVTDEDSQVKYVIYVQMDSSAINESMEKIRTTILISVLLAMILAAFMSLIFANTITEPIALLTKRAKQLAKGDLEQHIIVKSNDEIGQLTRSFNYMARELRKTVSEMSKEKNKLEIILHNMTDGILAFDDIGIVVHANSVCCDILETEKKDITLENFLDRVKVDKADIVPNIIIEVMMTSKGRFIAVNIVPYSNSSKERVDGIVVVFQDITKQKKLDDMRKQFVANVSHEVKTPLAAIMGAAETLLDGAIDDKDFAMDFLNTIMNAAKRMKVLSDDLLELSRLDSKKMQFNMTEIDLREFVHDGVKLNRIAAQNKNQKVILERTSEKPMIIYGDNNRLNQVMDNIISNSVKYSPENTEIKVSLYEENGKYCIAIEDSGMGIPKEDLSRIFERFYRVDKARSRTMGGNGLGLSIAVEIMEAHGGKIVASSEVGKGTTMVMKFNPFRK